MGTTTTKGVPYPVPSDPPDVPADMGLLATWVDSAPGVGIFTTPQRDALVFPALWSGRTIYNTTTARVEAYTSIGWLPVGGYVQALNTIQRDALPLKPAGYTVFNTDAVRLQTWDGNRWQDYGFMPNLSTTARDALTAGQKLVGQIIWNTTNGVHEAWNGTSWGQIAGSSSGSTGAAGIVGFTSAFSLAAVTAQTVLATVTFAALPGRRYEVTGYVNYTKNTTTDGVNVYLYDGATAVVFGAELVVVNAYAVSSLVGTFATGATARTATITMQIATPSGTVTPARGYMVVSDVGADTQVATPTGIVNPNVWNVAWGEVARGINTVGQSGFSADTDVVTATFTAQSGRRYRYTFSMDAQAITAGGVFFAKVTDGSNNMLNAGQFTVATSGYSHAVVVYDDVTGTAGARTIKGRASQIGGGTVTTQSGAQMPALMIIEDAGPVNAVAPDTWPPNPLPGIWTAVTLLNSWANYGAPYQVTQYRKVGDIVYVRGVIRNGVNTQGTILFTLPTGFKPPASLQFAQEAVNTHAAIEVRATGDVVINIGSASGLALAFEFSTVA